MITVVMKRCMHEYCVNQHENECLLNVSMKLLNLASAEFTDYPSAYDERFCFLSKSWPLESRISTFVLRSLL